MPIYEYECESCGKVVEAWQKFSDPPLTTCEECGGKLHKLISMSSFHLKGTGWYVTDYAGKKADSTKEKSSSKSDDTAKKTGSTSITKPSSNK